MTMTTSCPKNPVQLPVVQSVCMWTFHIDHLTRNNQKICVALITIVRTIVLSYVIYVKYIFFRILGSRSLLLTPLRTTSVPNLAASPRLASLVFMRHDSAFYTHCNHTLHHVPETQAHRNMRLKNAAKAAGKAGSSHHLRSPPHSASGLRSPQHSVSGLRSPPHSASGLRSPPHSITGARIPLPVSRVRVSVSIHAGHSKLFYLPIETNVKSLSGNFTFCAK